MEVINIRDELALFSIESGICIEGLQFPNASIDVDTIKVMMINEVPPLDHADYFYSEKGNPYYMLTTIPLFKNAGVDVDNISGIIDLGIYITTAVKSPKTEYTVDKDIIKNHLPILEHEINMFPNLKVIMLMGDVAKKSFNLIARKNKQKSVTGSTYKIRKQGFYFKNIRVMPSYIMTGGNILMEKSKVRMISEDITQMMNMIV